MAISALTMRLPYFASGVYIEDHHCAHRKQGKRACAEIEDCFHQGTCDAWAIHAENETGRPDGMVISRQGQPARTLPVVQKRSPEMVRQHPQQPIGLTARGAMDFMKQGVTHLVQVGAIQFRRVTEPPPAVVYNAPRQRGTLMLQLFPQQKDYSQVKNTLARFQRQLQYAYRVKPEDCSIDFTMTAHYPNAITVTMVGSDDELRKEHFVRLAAMLHGSFGENAKKPMNIWSSSGVQQELETLIV